MIASYFKDCWLLAMHVGYWLLQSHANLLLASCLRTYGRCRSLPFANVSRPPHFFVFSRRRSLIFWAAPFSGILFFFSKYPKMYLFKNCVSVEKYREFSLFRYFMFLLHGKWKKLGTYDWFFFPYGNRASDYNGLLVGSRSNKNNELGRFVRISFPFRPFRIYPATLYPSRFVFVFLSFFSFSPNPHQPCQPLRL